MDLEAVRERTVVIENAATLSLFPPSPLFSLVQLFSVLFFFTLKQPKTGPEVKRTEKGTGLK